MKLPLWASCFKAESFEGQLQWSDILAKGEREESFCQWSRESYDLNGVVKVEQDTMEVSSHIQGGGLY